MGSQEVWELVHEAARLSRRSLYRFPCGLVFVMLGLLSTFSGVDSVAYCSMNIPHILILVGMFLIVKGLVYLGTLARNYCLHNEENAETSEWELAQFMLFATLDVALLIVAQIFYAATAVCDRYLKQLLLLYLVIAYAYNIGWGIAIFLSYRKRVAWEHISSGGA